MGGASFDSLIHLDEFPSPTPQTIHQCRFQEGVGSTGVGKAVNLARLGFETTLQANVGKDMYGSRIEEFLQIPNLTFLPYYDAQGTERHVNLMDANGDRISIFVHNSSDNPPIDLEAYLPALLAADVVIINIVNYCRKMLAYCQAHQKEVWTDLHDYDGKNLYHQDFLDASSYVLVSSLSLPAYKTFMHEQIQKGKKIVICTHGKEGASLLSANGEWIDMPILSDFELVDSNGAGDAFFAGFVYAYQEKMPLRKCMQIATIVAGLAISSPLIAYPDLNKIAVEKMWEKYYQH